MLRELMEDADSTTGEFSLMMKREEYWARALDQAMAANPKARPISIPYLHGFNLGLVQILPNTTSSQDLMRRVVLNTMLTKQGVAEDVAWRLALSTLDDAMPEALAPGSNVRTPHGRPIEVTLVDGVEEQPQDGLGMMASHSVYMVFCRDHTAATCMASPRLVKSLAALLMVTEGELLVVPYTECTLFVGVSSNAASALLLGMHTLAEARPKTSNALSSTPYVVAAMPKNTDPLPFVAWRKYPAHGVLSAVVARDGLTQYPVPTTAAMADSLRAQLQGAQAGALLVEGKGPEECHQCGAAAAPDGGKLAACARCLVARYCSRDCQLAHFKQHKPFCKQWAKKG